MAATAEDFTGTSSRPKSVAELVAAFDSRVATSQKMRSPTSTTIQSSPPTRPKPKSSVSPLKKNPKELDWRSKQDRLKKIGSYVGNKADVDVTIIKRSCPPLRPPLMNHAASISRRQIGHDTSTAPGSGVGIPIQKELVSKNVQLNPLQQQTKRQPKEAKASTAMKVVSCPSPQRKGIILKDVTNSMRNDNTSQKSASVPAKKTNTKLNEKALATIALRRRNKAAKEKTQTLALAGNDVTPTTTTDINDFESSIGVALLDTQRHEHEFVYDNTPDSSFAGGVEVIMALTAPYLNAQDDKSDSSTHNTETDCSSYNAESSLYTEIESSFYWQQQLFGSFRLPSVTAMVESTITTPVIKNSKRNHDYYDDEDDDDFVAEPRYPSTSNRMERDKAIGSGHRNNVRRSESFFACFDFDEIRHAIRETVL